MNGEWRIWMLCSVWINGRGYDIFFWGGGGVIREWEGVLYSLPTKNKTY